MTIILTEKQTIFLGKTRQSLYFSMSWPFNPYVTDYHASLQEVVPVASVSAAPSWGPVGDQLVSHEIKARQTCLSEVKQTNLQKKNRQDFLEGQTIILTKNQEIFVRKT